MYSSPENLPYTNTTQNSNKKVNHHRMQLVVSVFKDSRVQAIKEEHLLNFSLILASFTPRILGAQKIILSLCY
jgi:hypothetical protein